MSFKWNLKIFSVNFFDTRLTFLLLAMLITVGGYQPSAIAEPQNTQNYVVLNGGLTDIHDGAYVEGSARHGGIQPDYHIDLQAEPLKSLLAESAEIGKLPVGYWDKVGMVVDLLRSTLVYHDYYNPYYRRLLKQYRDSQRDIPLNEYVACGAGVCREHALLLHFALKSAGIPNKHAYASIYRASRSEGWSVNEDHAFLVVRHQGVDWVVDSYYRGFNGFRLQDLMSRHGITKSSVTAPIADPMPGIRRIVAINSFPKIYNPRSTVRSCRALFLN
ncbi:transglutaminase domain-containing protein [Pseudobdellovibrio exovorus]|uniref:Transglutaminase-like domain-containing protein n=1 Tax=Pseudobdellovibrio exovorus JSS TaxID=1184267 RepID=M4VTZ3_9BACT|nr:transglutaminase domain-containing protein [Pseudobdellovibrio exovorus]AGH96684.1 hypothetical protein A11Q_2468 [Pseudobdellovibrio exovorus JSS]